MPPRLRANMTRLPANLPQLLMRQRDGDEAARAAVLEPFQPWLRLLARLQIDAEFQGKFDPSDITQQTMLEAYRDLPKFRGQSEPELLAWLRQILANVLAHEIRRHRGAQKRDLRARSRSSNRWPNHRFGSERFWPIRGRRRASRRSHANKKSGWPKCSRGCRRSIAK